MRRLAAALVAAALLVPALARADVSEYLGRRIVAIAVDTENQRVTDARLLAMVDAHVGDALTMGALRESVTHLFSLGRFEDVRVHASATGDGVALRFELVPLHPVTRLAFTGIEHLAGIDEGRLRRVVAERFGALPRAGRAPDVARLVEDELRRAGYLHARVTPATDVQHVSEESTLRFAVQPGARTRIGAVRVEGDPGMPLATLLAALDLAAGSPYQPDRLNTRVDQYIESRKSRGFLEARLAIAPAFAANDSLVNLTIAVTQGPRVRVAFTGDPLPAERRDELVTVSSEGSADEDLLEDASNRIEDYLRAQGYRDAVAPHARVEQGRELLITFAVKKGPQYRVARIDVSGNAAIPLDMVQRTLRIRAGQPFSSALLDSDVAGIEDLYRREGFPAVRVDAAAEPAAEHAAREIPVDVTIAITEGARTIVNSVQIRGNQSVSEEELRAGLGLQPGRPFFATQLAIDRDAIQLHYANLGYQSATVESSPGVSADGTRADVVFTVREGPRIVIDHVLIVGNERTRTSTIERELQFKPGDPLGLAAVSESQRRLAALGLFRRARITELGHGDENRRDVLVTIEEAPVTTIGYGGGIEGGQRSRIDSNGVAAERLEVAPRAFFEVGRRNLFGKNRSINLFTRISLRPSDSTVPGEDGRGFGFSEYRVLGTFREPRALGTAADAFLTGVFEQQARTSFNFSRRGFTAEAGRRISRWVSLSGNYQIQRTELFDEKIKPADKLLVDRLFPQVLLSSFSTSAIRDTRDDQLDPSDGNYLSANAQIAARRIGSEVGLAKSYLTAQLFRLVPKSRRVVMAGSARLGLAVGFPRTVIVTDADNRPGLGRDGQPTIGTVRDLPASERFFAGGDTTVRGFTLDALGTPNTIDSAGLPIGGNALVIFNAELRAPLRGGLGLVTFFDTGNVFARSSDINLAELRSAVGFGIRYKSPIGPIRFDLGFKLHRNVISGVREPLTALHISLGQAF